MAMMVKLSTSEAKIVAVGLGKVLKETAENVAGLLESEDDNVDDLMMALSTQHRASILYAGLWKALGATDEVIVATIEGLLGEGE